YQFTVFTMAASHWNTAVLSLPTTTVLTSTGTGTSTYGDAAIFNASVTSSGVPVSTGIVTFMADTQSIGSVPVGADGTAALTTSGLTMSALIAGSHNITAVYKDNTYVDASSTSLTFIQTVNPATLTVTADDASRQFGAANQAFTGAISGIQNSD